MRSMLRTTLPIRSRALSPASWSTTALRQQRYFGSSSNDSDIATARPLVPPGPHPLSPAFKLKSSTLSIAQTSTPNKASTGSGKAHSPTPLPSHPAQPVSPLPVGNLLNDHTATSALQTPGLEFLKVEGAAPSSDKREVIEINMCTAVRDALEHMLTTDPTSCVLGEDVSFGGVFRATAGLADRYGEERVINVRPGVVLLDDWRLEGGTDHGIA